MLTLLFSLLLACGPNGGDTGVGEPVDLTVEILVNIMGGADCEVFLMDYETSTVIDSWEVTATQGDDGFWVSGDEYVQVDCFESEDSDDVWIRFGHGRCTLEVCDPNHLHENDCSGDTDIPMGRAFNYPPGAIPSDDCGDDSVTFNF